MYQHGAPLIPIQQNEVIEGEEEDSEFQIAMTNLANAKSRYLGSKPPLPPPSSTKPTKGRAMYSQPQPQPLPPIPQNVELKRAPVQHRNMPDPICNSHPIRQQDTVIVRQAALVNQSTNAARPIDPIDSVFSDRPSSMAFSPLQLARLPDFNFEDGGERVVDSRFRMSQFYPSDNQQELGEPELRQSDSADYGQTPLHSSSCSSDQQVKVAMLPPTKPSAVCARRQQKSQFNYTSMNRPNHMNNSGNSLDPIPTGATRFGPVYEQRGAEERGYVATNSNQSLTGSFTGSTASQTHLNGVGGRIPGDPRFIPVNEISSFKGLVKRPSRFVGHLWKLGRNKWWQKRTFTIDHSYFICFKEGKVSGASAAASREPGTPSEVTNHLVWDDLRIRKTWNENRIIKWILPLEQLDGIYLWKRRDYYGNEDEDSSVLDKLALKLKTLLFDPCGASQLIDSASMVKTEIDIGGQYEWIDVLDKFRMQRKVSMEEMKRRVRECNKCFILLTTSTGHFHLLRTENEYELFNWCMLLAAKRVLLGN